MSSGVLPDVVLLRDIQWPILPCGPLYASHTPHLNCVLLVNARGGGGGGGGALPYMGYIGVCRGIGNGF